MHSAFAFIGENNILWEGFSGGISVAWPDITMTFTYNFEVTGH